MRRVPRPDTISLCIIARQRKRIRELDTRMSEAWRLISKELTDAEVLAEVAWLLRGDDTERKRQIDAARDQG